MKYYFLLLKNTIILFNFSRSINILFIAHFRSTIVHLVELYIKVIPFNLQNCIAQVLHWHLFEMSFRFN